MRVRGDDLAGREPHQTRLEPLRLDPPRAADVLRLESSRFARGEVPQHHERMDRGHFRDGALVPDDVALLKRGESDERRDAVHLAALLLAEQFRGGRHGPAERPRDFAGEPFRQGVLAQVDIEASVDFLDPRDERFRVVRSVDAHRDEGSDVPDLARGQFPVLSADLQDALVVPSSLLLARITDGRLDSDSQVEVLDGSEVPEPTDRLHRDREVVRVLLSRDLRERHPLIRRERGQRIAKELGNHELAVHLRPAGADSVSAAGLAALDVEGLDRLYHGIPFPEALRAEALVDGALCPALDAEHLVAFSIDAALLKCWRGDDGLRYLQGRP